LTAWKREIAHASRQEVAAGASGGRRKALARGLQKDPPVCLK
jgi:hypothetical protein